MADDGKVVMNLTTGHEDADKVTVAFLVATAALAKEHSVVMFLTKEAVRLGLPGYADAIETAGAPPVTSCSTSSRKAAANSMCARSASTRASSTATRSWPTQKARRGDPSLGVRGRRSHRFLRPTPPSAMPTGSTEIRGRHLDRRGARGASPAGY